MSAKLLIPQITNDTIEALTGHPLPVLIACLRKDNDFQGHLEDLESLAHYFHGKMNVCHALEDVFPYFQKRYGISGTPTYLVLYRGDVLDAVLGKISVQELIKQAAIILLSSRKQDEGEAHNNNPLNIQSESDAVATYRKRGGV